MTREELKPCPFCGGKAERGFVGNDFTKSRKVEIECTECHARMVVGAIRNTHEWCDETVTKRWNDRQPPLPPAEGAEVGLREHISDLLHAAHYDTGDMDDNAFDKWIKKMIKSIDKYFKNEQPTAEGAEAFIRAKIADYKLHDCYPTFVPEMAQVMTAFAAQEVERVIEERMPKEKEGRDNLLYSMPMSEYETTINVGFIKGWREAIKKCRNRMKGGNK